MSIGESLAAARRRAGLTVAQVSHRTRIRQTLIKDIEADNYSACGGDFYARGHIRAIAKAVGADSEPLISAYDAAHRAPGTSSATTLGELAEQARTAQRRDRTRLVALATLVALAIAAGVVISQVLSGPRQATAAAGNRALHQHRASHGTASLVPPASPAPSASASPAGNTQPAAPVRTLTPVSAVAVGAGGPGQGDNPQLARLAIDHNQATAWHTDWYTSAVFGNLYPGTGLLLDMGRPVTITGAQVTLGSAPGASLQLRVGTSPAVAGLHTVAHAAGASGVVRLRVTAPARGRYVLVWFTRLPTDAAGTFQARVYDVTVQARS